jgi:hypothetical protein
MYKVTKLRIKLFLTTFVLFGLVFVPTFLRAENEIMLQESDIDVQTIPENPEPYQDVTIKLVSYATDLNRAMIVWRSGSSTILSGYGKTSYSFKTFGANTTIVFDVTITPSGSTSGVSKKISISPSEVEVFWESVDGYLPPFYKGKSFITRESTIKVVAIPNSNVVKQGKGNIAYTWKNKDNTVQNASGYNKDSYVFKNDILNNSEDVTVSVSSVDGKYSAIKTISIPMVSPKIIFYKKSPTEGILYNQALTNDMLMEEDEMTIVAEPYFLATKGNEYFFDYYWKINGEDIATPSKKSEITIRPSSRGGYATIDLYMENLKTLYQEVSGSLKLNL